MQLRATSLVAALFVIGIGLLMLHEPLACSSSCFADLEALHGRTTGRFAIPDMRLNAWILSWVQHAMLSLPPSQWFDANTFYPAVQTLTGSEHLMGQALLTLPLRAIRTDAVFLYQSALFASYFILAATTFAFARWLTGSVAASALAAATAMAMPWRWSELSHLQLESAHWIPLIWLGVGRLLCDNAGRRVALWLFPVMTLQLLSSFYLAYYTTFSCGLLFLVIAIWIRPPLRAWLRLTAALAPAYGIFVVTALPYLARQADADLPGVGSVYPTSLATAWLMLAPPLEWWSRIGAGSEIRYHIPLVVFAAGVVSLAFVFRAGDAKRRAVAAGLWIVCLSTFVLMIGDRATFGGREIEMPAAWASHLIPGFGNLRAPFRWGIVIGLAAPILAALGLRFAADALRSQSRALKIGAGTLLLAVWAAQVPWRPMPAKPVWNAGDSTLRAHRALAALPPGVVLELPWPLHPLHQVERGSRYQLASTVDWNPMLSGFTAYVPPSFHLLRRVVQGLPDASAIAQLEDLVDVRYWVIHEDGRPGTARDWERTAREQGWRQAHREPGFRIYEAPNWETSGPYREALGTREPRTHTLTGLPRTPLDLSAEDGTWSFEPPRVLFVSGTGPFRNGMPGAAHLRIENETASPWPSFDVQTEGLILIRYRFETPQGEIAYTGATPLDADVPPHTRIAARAYLTAPRDAGDYRLHVHLVQEVDGAERALPFPRFEHAVKVQVLPSPRRPAHVE